MKVRKSEKIAFKSAEFYNTKRTSLRKNEEFASFHDKLIFVEKWDLNKAIRFQVPLND